jgi:hypothetical protein
MSLDAVPPLCTVKQGVSRMSTLGYVGVATLVLLLSVAAPAFAVVTSRVLRSDALTCNVVSSVRLTSNVLTSNAVAANAIAAARPTSDALVATRPTIAGLNIGAIEGVSFAPDIGP